MEKHIIYDEQVIQVSLQPSVDNPDSKQLAIRYLNPGTYTDNGSLQQLTNAMGGETDWFVLPYTFAVEVGKKLFELRNAGIIGFNESGYSELKRWLIDHELIDDAMCY